MKLFYKFDLKFLTIDLSSFQHHIFINLKPIVYIFIQSHNIKFIPDFEDRWKIHIKIKDYIDNRFTFDELHAIINHVKLIQESNDLINKCSCDCKK